MANRIQLIGGFRQEEAIASGAVTPGHLVELTSATAPTVKVHATEAGIAERAFAIEDALQGNTVSDIYATGSLVTFILPYSGSVVNALIKAGEDISIADKLISAGDGTLIAEGSATSGTTVREVIAVAVEAQDLTASGAVATLTAVRVL